MRLGPTPADSWLLFLVTLLLASCGGSSSTGSPEGGTPDAARADGGTGMNRDAGTNRDAGHRDGGSSPTPDAGVPMATCDAPALYDVSSPTAMVGDGTAGELHGGARSRRPRSAAARSSSTAARRR